MTIRELYVIKEFVSGSPIYHLAFKEVHHFENLQGVWHDEVCTYCSLKEYSSHAHALSIRSHMLTGISNHR